jgi:hypothetical protein
LYLYKKEDWDMRRGIIDEINLQEARQEKLKKFSGPGEEKGYIIFKAIDEIFFSIATAKLNAIMFSLLIFMVFTLWDIVIHPNDFSLTVIGEMIFTIAIAILSCKVAYGIIRKYFTDPKIKKICEDIILKLEKDSELRELLYFIRMNSVSRDRQIGTKIIQQMLKQ